jgi:hypothetical protein
MKASYVYKKIIIGLPHLSVYSDNVMGTGTVFKPTCASHREIDRPKNRRRNRKNSQLIHIITCHLLPNPQSLSTT